MIIEGVASESFKLAINELFQFLKQKPSLFSKFKNFDVDNAYLKASKVEEVKTIWQVDKNVNLNEFYYPSKIFIDSDRSDRVEIGSLNNLPENGKIIIQGTAGQGKSIFLRYLAGKELRHGNTIPIFIELRKITDRNSLENLILNALSNLGIEVNREYLNLFYKSNKCTLLLDAFDEVKESQVQDTVTYLEGLCEKYHNLRIVVASRPNSDIQPVIYFRVVDLCPLIPSDFPAMLEKFFSSDKETKVDVIVKAIHSNEAGIKDLITTPLLLTLLTITYKSYHRIPEQLNEFYDNLFYLLVNRHDSTKPGFSREFKSGLNENKLEELFCAFCFYCMLEQKDTFSNSDAISLVKKAKKVAGYDDVCERNFLDDVKKNTCLIVEEGFEYHFIHKSIKEYHAASFISRSPNQLKEKFYSLALKQLRIYLQVIIYLKAIDSYYCSKLFLMPIYEKLFDLFRYKDGEMGIDKGALSDIVLSGLRVGVVKGDLASLQVPNVFVNIDDYFHLIGVVLKTLNDSVVKDKYKESNEVDMKSALTIYEGSIEDNFFQNMLIFLRKEEGNFMELKKAIEEKEKAIDSIII